MKGLVGPKRFELLTFRLSAGCSTSLSYGPLEKASPVGGSSPGRPVSFKGFREFRGAAIGGPCRCAPPPRASLLLHSRAAASASGRPTVRCNGVTRTRWPLVTARWWPMAPRAKVARGRRMRPAHRPLRPRSSATRAARTTLRKAPFMPYQSCGESWSFLAKPERPSNLDMSESTDLRYRVNPKPLSPNGRVRASRFGWFTWTRCTFWG